MIGTLKARISIDGEEKAFEGDVDKIIADIDAYLVSKKTGA
jgi:hypothetical protein